MSGKTAHIKNMELPNPAPLIQPNNQAILSPQPSPAKQSYDFMLTEAQKIYIQHHLPKYFTLLPITKANSRLNITSKNLIEQSLTFIERKRGRPEGQSRRSASKQSLERKSARIAESTSRIKSNSSIQKSNHSSSNLASSQEKQSELYKSNYVPEKNEERNVVSEQFSVSLQEQMAKTCKESQINDLKIKEDLWMNQKEEVKQNEGEQKKNIKSGGEQNVGENFKAGDTHNQPSPLKSDDLQFKKPRKNKLSKLPRPKKPKKQMEVSQQKPSLQIQHQVQQRLSLEQLELKSKSQLQIQRHILHRLKSHKQILPFLEPVDEARDCAPNYYKQITTPIDIQTIEFKLSTCIYKSPDEFHSDIRLMWANSKSYNRKNEFMQRVTSQLENFYLNILSRGKNARRGSSKNDKI